jgi:hypothetical protein
MPPSISQTMSLEAVQPETRAVSEDAPLWRQALTPVLGAIAMALLGAGLANYLDLGFAAAGLS